MINAKRYAGSRAVAGIWVLVLLVLLQIPANATGADGPSSLPAAKLHPGLDGRLREAGPGGEVKAWVLFRRDKSLGSTNQIDAALDELHRSYDPRAIQRRTHRRTRAGLFDVDDLPLPEPWINAVRATGAQIVVHSRWAAAVSVRATAEQLRELASLPFVTRLRPVLRGGSRRPATRSPADLDEPLAPRGDFYGEAQPQLEQIDLPTLHALGYTGLGMRIGVLDTGFRTTHAAFNQPRHPLDVVAEWDFVNDDAETGPEAGDLSSQHNHGTWILGTMAAYLPGVLVGAAYDASYILAKVEDLSAEYPAEEDLFVAGLEFIEANGGDIATSSVVIFDHYTQDQLDGETSVMSQGLNVAAANGLHVCQGAGNSGHDSNPEVSSLVPPADAFLTITVGAVDALGNIANFSSDGPTADGRLKPEVLARGVNTRTVSSQNDTGLSGVDGTSLSTPLVAGASACVLQAHPEWTVDELRTQLFLNGDYYLAAGRPDPLFVRGFGTIDVLATFERDCNGNDVDDPTDLADHTSGDCNGNGIPDECDVAALVSPDDATDGLPDECTACVTGPGCPGQVETLRLSKLSTDLVLSWQPASNGNSYSILRDTTAQAAGATPVGSTIPGELSWVDVGALNSPPTVAFYLVRGVTSGGVVGP